MASCLASWAELFLCSDEGKNFVLFLCSSPKLLVLSLFFLSHLELFIRVPGQLESSISICWWTELDLLFVFLRSRQRVQHFSYKLNSGFIRPCIACHRTVFHSMPYSEHKLMQICARASLALALQLMSGPLLCSSYAISVFITSWSLSSCKFGL